MRKKIFFKIVCVCAFFLAGCSTIPTSQMLGISDAEWQKYSADEQQELLNTYQQISDQKSALAEKQKKINKSKNGNSAITNGALTVGMHSGKVLMPPFAEWQEYKPVTFSIHQGECKEVLLVKPDASNQVNLGVCYKEKILYLDPSKYDLSKQFGSITFHYSPLWDQGFSYVNINSSGYVRLKDVTVEIK